MKFMIIPTTVALWFIPGCSGEKKSPEYPRHSVVSSEPEVETRSEADIQAEKLMGKAAGHFLRCFHPSQHLAAWDVLQAKIEGDIMGIDAIITMNGLAGQYKMRILVAVDIVNPPYPIVVKPIQENTVFPAKPDCPLREGIATRDIDDAADAAVLDFAGDVLEVVRALDRDR